MYAGRPACVLSSLLQCSEATTPDLHHLDDDNRRSTLDNLLPLCGPHNRLLETFRNIQSGSAIDVFIPPALKPSVLSGWARQLISRGECAEAYAISRLGVAMMRQYYKALTLIEPFDDEQEQAGLWSCLNTAVIASSYTTAPTELLCDVISRDIGWAFEYSIRPPAEYSALLVEVAIANQGLGNYLLAEELLRTVRPINSTRLHSRHAISALLANKSRCFARCLDAASDVSNGSTRDKMRYAMIEAWSHLREGHASKAIMSISAVSKAVSRSSVSERKIVVDPMFRLEYWLTYRNAHALFPKPSVKHVRTAQDEIQMFMGAPGRLPIQLRPLATELTKCRSSDPQDDVYAYQESLLLPQQNYDMHMLTILTKKLGIRLAEAIP